MYDAWQHPCLYALGGRAKNFHSSKKKVERMINPVGIMQGLIDWYMMIRKSDGMADASATLSLLR